MIFSPTWGEGWRGNDSSVMSIKISTSFLCCFLRVLGFNNDEVPFPAALATHSVCQNANTNDEGLLAAVDELTAVSISVSTSVDFLIPWDTMFCPPDTPG